MRERSKLVTRAIRKFRSVVTTVTVWVPSHGPLAFGRMSPSQQGVIPCSD
jgi:hypothetical protein